MFLYSLSRELDFSEREKERERGLLWESEKEREKEREREREREREWESFYLSIIVLKNPKQTRAKKNPFSWFPHLNFFPYLNFFDPSSGPTPLLWASKSSVFSWTQPLLHLANASFSCGPQFGLISLGRFPWSPDLGLLENVLLFMHLSACDVRMCLLLFTLLSDCRTMKKICCISSTYNSAWPVISAS